MGVIYPNRSTYKYDNDAKSYRLVDIFFISNLFYLYDSREYPWVREDKREKAEGEFLPSARLACPDTGYRSQRGRVPHKSGKAVELIKICRLSMQDHDATHGEDSKLK